MKISRNSLNSAMSASFYSVVKQVPIFTSFVSSPSSARFTTSSSSILGLDPSSCLSNASRMSFSNSTSSSELSMLSSEQSVLLSILETWGSFEVLRAILERMTDGKMVKNKKGGHSFCAMARWIYLEHIGIFEIKEFME